MIRHILLSTIAVSTLGVHLSMPNSEQTSSKISQQINSVEQQLQNDLASIEQLFGSGSASSMNQSDIEQKMHAVNQYLTKVQQLMDENVAETYHVHRLPTVHSVRSVQLANGITLSAGDNGVRSRIISVASDFISQVSLPILQANLGETPKNTKVVLFSTESAYGDALAEGGVDEGEIPSIVAGTGGITVGSQVWIPLYALQDESDLANVLTHELTHATFNQEGIGDDLPTWVNEGTAWMDGMAAQQQVDPNTAAELTAAYNQDVEQAAESGQTLPLTASEDDILNAQYNVEWEDYLAVKQLVNTYGLNQFQAFLANTGRDGVAQSFANTFGMSITDFEQKFDAGLGLSQG